MSYPLPQPKEWRQNPAYRSALTYLVVPERVMTKQKTELFGKCSTRKLLQDPVMRRAYEAGKGFGISPDASRPAWEKKWVRKIIMGAEI